MTEKEVLIENRLIHGLTIRTFIVLFLFTVSIVASVVATYYSLSEQNIALFNKFEQIQAQQKNDSLFTRLQIQELKERVELNEAEINSLSSRLDNYLYKK